MMDAQFLILVFCLAGFLLIAGTGRGKESK